MRHADALEPAVTVENEPLVTSSHVAGETWTLRRRRAGHTLAWRWLDGARAWLRVHDERPYSFVDATSFVLMRKLRICDALPFDATSQRQDSNELRP